MNSLKIGTINTWKCDGNYFKRIEYLSKELIRLNLDIVLCQECFFCQSKQIDTIGFLASELGINKCYVPAREKERFFMNENLVSESGMGVLSRYEILENTSIGLPIVPGDDLRVIQKVLIKLPNDENIEIFNIHMTHIETAENHRLSQINFLINQIVSTDNFKIVGGDFNALPHSFEIEKLINSGNLIDIFKEKNPTLERISLVQPFEKGINLNVDYLFAPKRFMANKTFTIIDAQTILNQKNPKNNEYASDHFGVMTEIKIEL